MNIRKKISPVKGLRDSKATIDSFVTTLNKMFVLGQEIESTFASNITRNELLEMEQNRIDRLVSEGDNICRELSEVILQLEKLK
jgi:hypothetical protein